MKFNDIEQILKTSNPKDWLYNADDKIYTFKPDVRLNIIAKERKKFDEEWVRKYSNPNAWILTAKVFFGGSFVKYYLFAIVDEGRTIIGMPKSATELEITHLQHNMGRILDYRNLVQRLNDYDIRFGISEIEVKKALLY